jgi:hypothetical protein
MAEGRVDYLPGRIQLNSEKPRHAQTGNAMIYILLALALLGALTFTLTRQAEQGGDDISRDQAELLATDTTSYVGAAKNVVDQMMMTGSNPSAISFVRPNQASFDIAPHIHKVYHPSGGGLTLEAADAKLFTDTGTTPPPGWYMGRFNHVEWTPTTAQDILFVAYGISKSVCEILNKKITGTTTIPALATNPAAYFVDASITAVANADFTNTVCPSCVGYPSLCVSNAGGTQWIYYNIIAGR